jgi:Spy/CpxP family protein refolding chaperone
MRTKWAVLILSMFVATSVGFAQATKPAEKKDEKKEEKAKGMLPTYWKQLGLTEEQVQKVYKLQNKYNDEIDQLEAKIKDLKEKLVKERAAILTAEQKKRLEDILKEKAGTDKNK